MAYITAEARQELLDTVAEATDELGLALSAVGDAYEQLDEGSAERLEEQLFRPLQGAYGRARRTHAEFAGRHGLPARNFAAASTTSAATGARALVETAVEAVAHAEDILVELQDSMSPVEVGDAQLRAGLADVREILAAIPDRAQQFLRGLGR